MNEAELIIQARHNDESAWMALVNTHQEAVFRMAWLLLDDADDAEDVTQETFIRAFRALERFDETRPLRPWLLQIAKNLAHNHRRSLRRYVTAVKRWFDEGSTNVSNDVADPAPLYAEAQQAKMLRKAVAQLRQADQEIIYLRYFLESSVQESAEILGIAEGTVKSRLFRATERLRVVIERDFPQLREVVLS